MSQSVTDICNMALAHLGLQPIQDISDNSKRALACNQFFNNSRDDVFSEHRWPFCMTIQALALKSYTFPQWQYTYGYPVNAARVWTVFGLTGSLQVNPLDNSMTPVNSVADEESIEYETIYIPEDNIKVIATNEANAYCRYSFVIPDTTIWTPKFNMAFSYRLAAAMAHTLTGDASKGLQLMTLFQGFNSEEKRIGRVETTKKPVQVSGYQKARG
jgi:hypothetical protein